MKLEKIIETLYVISEVCIAVLGVAILMLLVINYDRMIYSNLQNFLICLVIGVSDTLYGFGSLLNRATR